ncbi:helix-turn-helix domain-containing protein [Butyrivibrio sp. DSM 10294]|uniref:response regulator transcription factor n=1 Tax=Butyrivibrio sp. DSM 10294 TaxID=2972457 RepID=UPI00234F9266|nr:helix-turn-helix domain-containing protein [Butyrivibrio sp. DSM 10294]MDC7295432.1 helix-turn-helix domain-containing protein [Butyrivibrio sp. DSM 10294]
MYRVMIADDEGIVIDSMKFIIEKEFGNQCEVEFAKTGRSGIELAERFRPDIAVIDIHMPGINGIDAIREMKQFCPGTIFIVMSAYDKFDYAKEAIKLGVMEYIMKPMDRYKVVKVLKKAMEQIDEDREKRSNELMIKEKLETIEPIIESGLIYDILLQEHFEEDVESYRSILGIKENYGYMLAIVCGDAQEGNHMTNAVGSSVKLSGKYKEIREGVKDFFSCKVGSVMANKIAVLVPYERAKMEYGERTELIERARDLTRYLRKKTDITFRIGVGGVKPLKELGESYRQALNALIATTASVAHVDDLTISCNYEDDYPIQLEKPLFDAVAKGDLNGMKVIADKYADWMCVRANDGDIMSMRLKVLEFSLYAEHLAYQNGGQTYKYSGRTDYLPEIMGLSTTEELRDWFMEKLTSACRNVINKREERSNDIIKTAKQFIEDNYSKDISLDDVSRKVNISPYYFSKIFKDESGLNFIEYLTNLRIDNAKKLLSDTDMSIKEICLSCGYTDPNYFSRSFKKNVGITPTEYKDGKLAESV